MNAVMSAFGGALYFDRRAIDRGWLTAFGAAHDGPGPDGGSEVIAGPAALAHRALHVTPESRFERQPAHDSHGVWLCWDGRLDNANEIEAVVGRVAGMRADTHMVLAVYHRFGADFLSRLVGDFALALWDLPRRRLVLARDCAGTRTLYFHCDSDRVIWSTDLEALLRVGEIPFEPDEDFIADFLAYEIDPSRAPFRGVHAVRPAEAVTFSFDGRCDHRQFWTLDLDREVRHASDEEYAEQFRALFREAVRVRLRTDRPVVAELSGGLDSSSIVVMADCIVGGANTPRVETVSRVHEHAKSSDERRYIEIVERHRGRRGLYLTDAACPLFEDLESFAESLLPNPYCFAAAYHRALESWMREIGGRVLLCGLGGDEICGSRQNPAPELADLLVSGHIRRLMSRAAAWSESLREPWIATLYRHAVRPVFPLGVRRHLAAKHAASQLVFYRQDYITRARLRERLGIGLEPLSGGRPSARDQAAGFRTVVSQIATGFRRSITRADVTYPFLHRPLVEFMQAIPLDQKIRPGRTRIVQRAAVAGMLPDPIATRRSKGNPTESLARAFRQASADLARWLGDGRLAQKGYIDPDRVRTELSKAAIGASAATMPLIKLLSIELWFRALESRAHELRRAPTNAGTWDGTADGALRRDTVAVPESDLTRSTA